MNNEKVSFIVTVNYSNNEGGPVCAESMASNMKAAIENERQNGALTPSGISADPVTVAVIDVESELNMVYTDLVWHEDGVSELDKHNVNATIGMLESIAGKLGMTLQAKTPE